MELALKQAQELREVELEAILRELHPVRQDAARARLDEEPAPIDVHVELH
jgi:hypothetical protein